MKEQRAWWMPRRLTFWDSVILSVATAAACIMMSLMIYRGPEYGLPQHDRLVVTSGRVAYAGFTGGRNQYTIFRLDTSPTVFKFTGAMGDFVTVEKTLCKDCEVSVWTDPADNREQLFAWQIRVSGQNLALYPDVKAHWISDRKDADWFAPIAGIASIGFAIKAFLLRRKGKKRSSPRTS